VDPVRIKEAVAEDRYRRCGVTSQKPLLLLLPGQILLKFGTLTANKRCIVDINLKMPKSDVELCKCMEWFTYVMPYW